MEYKIASGHSLIDEIQKDNNCNTYKLKLLFQSVLNH